MKLLSATTLGFALLATSQVEAQRKKGGRSKCMKTNNSCIVDGALDKECHGNFMTCSKTKKKAKAMCFKKHSFRGKPVCFRPPQDGEAAAAKPAVQVKAHDNKATRPVRPPKGGHKPQAKSSCKEHTIGNCFNDNKEFDQVCHAEFLNCKEMAGKHKKRMHACMRKVLNGERVIFPNKKNNFCIDDLKVSVLPVEPEAPVLDIVIEEPEPQPVPGHKGPRPNGERPAGGRPEHYAQKGPSDEAKAEIKALIMTLKESHPEVAEKMLAFHEAKQQFKESGERPSREVMEKMTAFKSKFFEENPDWAEKFQAVREKYGMKRPGAGQHGEKPIYGGKPHGGEKPGWGSKPAWGSKPGGDKPAWGMGGGKPAWGDKKPQTKPAFGQSKIPGFMSRSAAMSDSFTFESIESDEYDFVYKTPLDELEEIIESWKEWLPEHKHWKSLLDGYMKFIYMNIINDKIERKIQNFLETKDFKRDGVFDELKQLKLLAANYVGTDFIFF